jgi:hypothetical protein
MRWRRLISPQVAAPRPSAADTGTIAPFNYADADWSSADNMAVRLPIVFTEQIQIRCECSSDEIIDVRMRPSRLRQIPGPSLEGGIRAGELAQEVDATAERAVEALNVANRGRTNVLEGPQDWPAIARCALKDDIQSAPCLILENVPTSNHAQRPPIREGEIGSEHRHGEQSEQQLFHFHFPPKTLSPVRFECQKNFAFAFHSLCPVRDAHPGGCAIWHRTEKQLLGILLNGAQPRKIAVLKEARYPNWRTT